MVNNEFPYSRGGSPREGKMYPFRANPDDAILLKGFGVDIVSLANNHSYDYKASGYNETQNVLLNAGINVGMTKFLSYILCGACAGLSGVLYAADYATVNSEIGTGYEMTAIAVCILGGVSIVGGRGRIDGIVTFNTCCKCEAPSTVAAS